jgi:catechol 2,3-dioxygenase-like lactoylglutathione lyase family enzyme
VTASSTTDIQFLASHPTLPSLDLVRTVVFYEDQLGFRRTLLTDEVAVLKRDRIELHFWKCDDDAIPASSGCRLQVTDAAKLRDHCLAAGLRVGALEGDDRYHVFPLGDPDGNLLWVFDLEGPPPWERRQPAEDAGGDTDAEG